jgi:hypothetical protein
VVTRDVGAPDVVEQLLAGHHAARPHHQPVEQRELLGRELDLVLVDEAAMALRVEAQRRALEYLRSRPARGLAPAQHCAHAQRELARAEWLGDVVVRADLEAHHPVDLVGARGEHDDRDLAQRRVGAQVATHLGAGEVREHQVEDQQIWCRPPRALERLATGLGGVHLEARPD